MSNLCMCKSIFVELSLLETESHTFERFTAEWVSFLCLDELFSWSSPPQKPPRIVSGCLQLEHSTKSVQDPCGPFPNTWLTDFKLLLVKIKSPPAWMLKKKPHNICWMSDIELAPWEEGRRTAEADVCALDWLLDSLYSHWYLYAVAQPAMMKSH